MNKRERNRRAARRPAFRDPKRVILVVCEGDATEPEYLRGFAIACHNPRVRIEIQGGEGVPKTIVEVAKELKRAAEKQAKQERDDNLRYDEIWCVFDIDQHPKVAEARQMAHDNGLELAISNPCIELWLMLHFREPPGMSTSERLIEMMRTHIAGYNKHVSYSAYAAGYEDAVKRAKRLDESAERDNEAGRNPTTGIWRLTESIRYD